MTGLAAAVAAARFLFGLGAATNLSDANPWGLWIGFDVMSGVALAAGGFIVTAIVYIFRLERFHAIVRPAVLTAFLGYLAVAVGLLFDLGLPWNIWHMIVFWNPHSPLFEVGWCVMLYLTVLALEFFPVPAEEFSALAKIRRLLMKARLPLVIVGIGLSTLHQSSLGSLFLIMPYHLHPLWYSPMLPLLFLVSAIGLGLMMVMFESHFTAYLYRRKPETEVLAGLGGAARWVLLAYAALRFGDLAARAGLATSGSPSGRWACSGSETAVMALLPAALLFIPRVRRTARRPVDRGRAWRLRRRAEPDRRRRRCPPRARRRTLPAGLDGVRHQRGRGVGGDAGVPVHGRAVPRVGKAPGRSRGGSAPAAGIRQSRDDLARRSRDRRRAPCTRWRSFSRRPSDSRCWHPSPPPAAASIRRPVHHARGGDTLWIDGNLDGYGVAFPHEAARETRPGARTAA